MGGWATGLARPADGDLRAVVMCHDDVLAAVALRIVTHWATQGHPVRRWTAAIAFSGVLASTDPTEATNRLWHLIVPASDSTDAIFALAQLFATLAAGCTGKPDGSWPCWTADEGSPPRPAAAGPADAVNAHGPVDQGRADRPSRVSPCSCRPMEDRRAIVGRLSGRCLWRSYRPLRRKRAQALLEAAAAFAHVSSSPEEDAHALGDALAAALQADEYEPLATQLIDLQRHAKRRRRDSCRDHAGSARCAGVAERNRNGGLRSAQPYPIVSHSAARRARPARAPGTGHPRRTADEVPPLQPHEVLVYRVNGHFVVDDGRHGRSDGRVVNASSVSGMRSGPRHSWLAGAVRESCCRPARRVVLLT